jgi:predicted DNA-binding ribbon-helix-helix protein
MPKKENPTDGERHSRICRICQDPRREEIELEFVEWKPLAVIAHEKKLSQSALYRHINATGLFGKRDRNLKAALSRFIERGYRVKVTAQSFIAAIQAMAKINSEGQWVDKVENVNARAQELFSRMSRAEMLRYAESGELPAWFLPGNPSRVEKESSG